MADVSDFDGELRECLAEVLGERPPEPEYEALAFYRHWLAERNLGLVPIDDAARVRLARRLARSRPQPRTETHAVVMFGSPSGPLVDPSGALASGGTIEAGLAGRPARPRAADRAGRCGAWDRSRWTGSTLQPTPRRRSRASRA